MPAICFSSVRGRRMRATKVNSCGAVVPGAAATLVTKGFVSVEYSFEIDEGEEIDVKNAAGEVCISEPGCPIIKWVNVEATFCNVDPDLVNLWTGWPLVVDGDGAGVGFRVQEAVACGAGIGLEVWSDISGTGACAGGLTRYGYWLAPWITNGIMGDITIENDAASFVLTGKTRKGSGWDTGPYNVVLDDEDAASPLLAAIGASDHLHIQTTTVAPPAAACGAATLTPV